MRVYVEGVGLSGPGLDGWASSRPLLAGGAGWQATPTRLVTSELLPPAERRRVGVPVKLALAVGREALAQARRDATGTATVLASSGGDCDNVHQLCEALAMPEREVSPTRFHNSVHNAAGGYWSIAVRSRAPSTSLCGHDWSFAAGLLEAATQVAVDGAAVVLIVYDHPYPDPLAAARRIEAPFGAALVLAPAGSGAALAALEVEYSPLPAAETPMPDAGLEALRAGVPAGRSLPLLAALTRHAAGSVFLRWGGGHLRVAVTPCA